jgi:lambda repressor-like predicted transcriptional regulator
MQTSTIKTWPWSAFLAIGVVTAQIACSSSTLSTASQFDWKQVEQVIGKAGTVQPDGVYKIGLPRTDLQVKVGDVELKPDARARIVARLQKDGCPDNGDGRPRAARRRSRSGDGETAGR